MSNNRNQSQSSLVDVSSMGLTCKTCTKPITELPFVPKTDKPLDCMGCHSGRDKSRDQVRDRNPRNRDGGGKHPHAYTKGEQMEVIFVEKDFPSGRRVVSYVTEESGSVIVYTKTRRFCPIPGKPYQCSVMFKKNERGAFGLALPTTPFTLTPKEWLPPEEMRSCMVVSLMFQQKRGRGDNQDMRLIAFHEGRAVFPDNGTEVQPGKMTTCLLREAGNVAFAIPIGVEQQTGKGLMLLGEALGEVLESDLKHVVVKAASKKAGVVGMPKVDKDLEISSEYRSIYEVLSDPEAKAMVNESSTEDEINKAYRRKAADLHPDKVAQSFGGMDKLPLPIKKNSEFFFEALGTAKERALDLIARKKAKSGKREAPKGSEAAQVQTSGQATAPTGDKPGKRDRKNRGDGSEQPQQPVAAAPVQPVETAPVEGAAEASVAEVPVNVEASSQEGAEAKPAVEAAPVGAPSKEDAEMEEIAEALVVARKTPQYAELTIEGFLGLSESIQKFYRKQARANLRTVKANAASVAGKKATEAKGSAPKGDFRTQLAGVKAGKQ